MSRGLGKVERAVLECIVNSYHGFMRCHGVGRELAGKHSGWATPGTHPTSATPSTGRCFHSPEKAICGGYPALMGSMRWLPSPTISNRKCRH
jgi:hypothetical protein